MFSAEVWGTVGEWIGAVGTGGAAIAAASFYILDTRRSQIAQARLVWVQQRVDDSREMAVIVTNNSNLPIVLDLMYWSEPPLRKALLSVAEFNVRSAAEPSASDFEVIHDPHKRIHSKDEIIGYSGDKGWTSIRASDKRVAAGQTITLASDVVLTYRVSMRYWITFQDASGQAWQLEIGPNHGKALSRRYKDFPYRTKLSGRLAITFSSLRRYITVNRWLWKHRSESTTPYNDVSATID